MDRKNIQGTDDEDECKADLLRRRDVEFPNNGQWIQPDHQVGQNIDACVYAV